MIKTNEEGYIFVSKSGKEYSLLEGVTFGDLETYTSDIVFIMDDKDENTKPELVYWMYGAAFVKELNEYIEDVVAEYERKKEV